MTSASRGRRSWAAFNGSILADHNLMPHSLQTRRHQRVRDSIAGRALRAERRMLQPARPLCLQMSTGLHWQRDRLLYRYEMTAITYKPNYQSNKQTSTNARSRMLVAAGLYATTQPVPTLVSVPSASRVIHSANAGVSTHTRERPLNPALARHRSRNSHTHKHMCMCVVCDRSPGCIVVRIGLMIVIAWRRGNGLLLNGA